MTGTGPSTSATVPGLIPVGYRWHYRPTPDGVKVFTGGVWVATVSSMEAAQKFVWCELARLFDGVYRADSRLPVPSVPQPK